MSRKVIQICIFQGLPNFFSPEPLFHQHMFFFFFTFLQRVQELPLPLWAATVSINASLGYQVISASVFTLVHVEIMYMEAELEKCAVSIFTFIYYTSHVKMLSPLQLTI